MRLAVVISLTLLIAPIVAHPVISRRDPINDNDVLNFALTLEHLENAFYTEGLAKYDQQAFVNAGLPSFARARFAEVAAHESTHVAFLTKVLGDKATKPCTYSFPYNDPKSFTALSQALEGTGVSAYSGAAKLIQNKDYLTAAAVVLSTEARHASWIASAVNKHAGWSGAFDVPLAPNQIFTLASAFIKSCPETNPPLPFKPFPALSVSGPAPKPGDTITVSSSASLQGKDLFAVFFTGLSTETVPFKDGKVTIPKDLRGQIYMVLSTKATDVDDSTIVAGPAILTFETNSQGQVV